MNGERLENVWIIVMITEKEHLEFIHKSLKWS